MTKANKQSKPDWALLMQPVYKEINIDGLGAIRIKTEMNGKDMLTYQEYISQSQKDGMVIVVEMAACKVQLMVVNDDDQPTFSSVDDVLKLPAEIILKIAEVLENKGDTFDNKVEEEAKK